MKTLLNHHLNCRQSPLILLLVFCVISFICACGSSNQQTAADNLANNEQDQAINGCPQIYYVNKTCYQHYFVGLDVPEDKINQIVVNADRYKSLVLNHVSELKNPLHTIKQNGIWPIYFHIEQWQGQFSDDVVANIRAEYQVLANQWIADLHKFDSNAPQTVEIKIFGFVFNQGVELANSFYRTYGNYPVVTEWNQTDEQAPWKIIDRQTQSEFDYNWYVVPDFDALQVVGNRTELDAAITFSPIDWSDYVHPEGLDTFFTKFWYKIDWDAVAQRQYLKLGGAITDFQTGETLSAVFLHEMGHTFFLDDIYSREKYPDADGMDSVMNGGSHITDFDRITMRMVWAHQKD